ncbi:MAG TPA: arylesterase [Stellaceae bacterium]|nr:arylesterase [Stellaceae bacterium]
MRPLPSLSKSYVFGHRIPLPETDGSGHIRVSKPACDARRAPAARAATGANGRTSAILAFGDSLTAGLGLPRGAAFPTRLEANLRSRGIAVSVVDGGVSGETTAGGLARVAKSLAQRPGFVVLELGTNDALQGIDPAVVGANLQKIIAKIRADGARLLLAGTLAPANWGRDYQLAFDAIYPQLARRYQVPLYPFFLDGVAQQPALNQWDGLHPNAQGTAVIADRLAPIVARLVLSVSRRR